jgi:tetratricopeptide (TPR) repeat protein
MHKSRLEQLFSFLEAAPNDPFTLYSIAYEYMQAGDFQEAIKYFLRLKEADPEYVGLYYHLGRCWAEIEEEEKAIATYRAGMAIAERKRDPHALSELRGALNQALGMDFEDDF